MKKILLFIIIVASACKNQYPWKAEVRELLAEGTAFLEEFTVKLEQSASAEEAIQIMKNYREELLPLLERHKELSRKYPELLRRDFPVVLNKLLPNESAAFLQAFQKANAIGEKIALKYKSPQFSQEAQQAWRSLFEAFQFR